MLCACVAEFTENFELFFFLFFGGTKQSLINSLVCSESDRKRRETLVDRTAHARALRF